MSNLITHAKKELGLIYSEEDLKEGYNKLAYDCILELIEVFSKQGHSGFSAPYVANMFKTLANFETLTPLTGEDDEWGDISNLGEDPKYQNIRNGAVFKNSDGSSYYIEAVVWRDSDGDCYTNGKSKMNVKFPLIPKTFYVDSYEDGSYNEKQYQEALDYYAKTT
jgi:hypothetical protein